MTVDEPGKARAAATDQAGAPTRPNRAGGHRAGASDAARAAGTSSAPGTSPDASGGGPGGGWAAPEASRGRRLLTTALAALGIAIGAAVVLGLVVAFLTRDVGSSSRDSAAGTPSLVIPAGGATSAGGAGAAVPSDWTEQTTSSGLVFRAPPGWTQRTDAVVDYRTDPNGPEQVGVGLSNAGDADSAATSYAQNTYSGQTSFAAQPAVDVIGSGGERARQITLTYTRQGTPVTVVVRALPTSRGVVVISTRATSDNPDRAVQLANSTDASLRRP